MVAGSVWLESRKKAGEPKREWREYTPAFFVRVANKGLTGYVKWKSAEVVENKGEGKRLKAGFAVSAEYTEMRGEVTPPVFL